MYFVSINFKYNSSVTKQNSTYIYIKKNLKMTSITRCRSFFTPIINHPVYVQGDSSLPPIEKPTLTI
jgi:hypothetical protein